jgi:hypothetical protein
LHYGKRTFEDIGLRFREEYNIKGDLRKMEFGKLHCNRVDLSFPVP